MREAGVCLVGGHTVEDSELKYGLAVTGFIHPDRILTKRNLKAGDHLILTKPLGTGIITTAIKAGLADAALTATVTRAMVTLNRDAALVMQEYPVHACTDITGFGLLGHLAEMVVDSGHGVRLCTAGVPHYPEALEWAAMGLIPAGAYNNKSFRGPFVEFSATVPQRWQDLLFDPQTSGGLLIAVAAETAPDLLAALAAAGIAEAALVGEVIAKPREKIVVE
jgi:selenide,water dikinase